VALFARAAIPGKSKTRLIPLLGAAGAAAFQAALTADAVRKLNSLGRRAARFLFVSGSLRAAPRPAGWKRAPQHGRTLGDRLERAFKRLLRAHPAAVILGTDSPELPPRVIRKGIEELRASDAVLGPCPDGGYYLIGLRRFEPRMLRDVRWGTRFAFHDTLARLLAHRFICSILEPCPDVDRPQDFRRLSSGLSPRLAPASRRFVRKWFGEKKTAATGTRAQSSRRPPLRRRRRRPRPGRA
jgi:rSAM/selenodomain-associated transferase 1